MNALFTLPESIALPSAWSTRRSLKTTRQRRLGKQCIGKAFFAECFFSGTRQTSLPSAREHSANKSGRYGARWRRWRLCRVSLVTLGKGVIFAECLPGSTRQRIHLCRVPLGTLGKEPARGVPCQVLCRVLWPRHSAKWPVYTFFICFLYSIHTNRRYHIYITYIHHIFHHRHK
jgi:hypothetical protein